MSIDYTDALVAAIDEEPREIVAVAYGKAGERIADVVASSYGLLWRGKEATLELKKLLEAASKNLPPDALWFLTEQDARALERYLPGRKAPETPSREYILIDWSGELGTHAPIEDRLPAWGPRTGNVYFPRCLVVERARSRTKLTMADVVC